MKNTLQYVHQLAKDLADKHLLDAKNKIGDEIKKLEKGVRYGITESEQRSKRVWEEVQDRFADS